jgi:hypothetical protein
MLRTLKPEDHPYRGLTEDEMRIGLVNIFDTHMLLKLNAQQQLATLFFGGRSLRTIPSATIYKALMQHSQTLTKCVSQDMIISQLQGLAMEVPTYAGACVGNTASKCFEQLWLKYTAVLRQYNVHCFDGTTVLAHTLMTLIQRTSYALT